MLNCRLFLIGNALALCLPRLVAQQPLYEVELLQPEFRRINQSLYPYPLTGGLNTPQFSSADLNDDGLADLYVFDRTGGVSMAFLHAGGVGGIDYVYAPAWVSGFPSDLSRWALLRDYDCDATPDMFAYTTNFQTGDIGIRVLRGRRNAQGALLFDEIQPVLQAALPGGGSQTIVVSSIDLPAVDDIDGDGDLDILTFHPIGSYVEWFKNRSQELGYGCDSLIFVKADDCWGRMYESGVSEALNLSPSPDSCVYKAGWTPLLRNGLHAGSTLLTLDMNADGNKELILGDLSFSNLNLLTNGGSPQAAWITSQEVFFPANSVPVNLPIFPAAFHVDVDNDGLRDLLVSPNSETNSINQHVVWYYKNIQTEQQPLFDFQQPNFLTLGMIDLGAHSAPAWADMDGDGLTDLIVGNFGIYQSLGNYTSSLFFFKNTGTPTQPSFSLTDTDFAGLQAYNIRRLAPAVGDLDGDGDPDLLVGQDDGTLVFVENKGTPTAPAFPNIQVNYELIDVGLSSYPALGDLDGDGDLDLVVGERNGNINYFQNMGTSSAADFANIPNTQTFGFIDTNNPLVWEGNSTVSLARHGGAWQLFVGNTMGQVWHFDSLENNLLGTFRPVYDGLWSLDEGDFSAPSAADIDGDGYLDFALGNRRGGLRLFRYDTTRLVGVLQLPPASESALDRVRLYPNPGKEGFWLEWDELPPTDINIVLLDPLGRPVRSLGCAPGQRLYVPTTALPAGIYLLRMESGGLFAHKIWVKSH